MRRSRGGNRATQDTRIARVGVLRRTRSRRRVDPTAFRHHRRRSYGVSMWPSKHDPEWQRGLAKGGFRYGFGERRAVMGGDRKVRVRVSGLPSCTAQSTPKYSIRITDRSIANARCYTAPNPGFQKILGLPAQYSFPVPKRGIKENYDPKIKNVFAHHRRARAGRGAVADQLRQEWANVAA